MNQPETTSFSRRNLPHWRVVGRSYFVTFRLKGSLPNVVVTKMQKYRQELEGLNEDQVRTLHYRRMFKMLEQTLDQANPDIGYLKIPNVAAIIVGAIEWAEAECGWRIPSYVVMPNHVHLLFAGGEKANRSLSKTLAIMKGFSAREANKVLNRKGSFWQSESFDHWCRNVDKELSVIRYIRNNPVKAGLVKTWSDWPWVK